MCDSCSVAVALTSQLGVPVTVDLVGDRSVATWSQDGRLHTGDIEPSNKVIALTRMWHVDPTGTAKYVEQHGSIPITITNHVSEPLGLLGITGPRSAHVRSHIYLLH